MTHERHANFLQDAGFHQPGIERVTKVMKTDVTERSIFQRRLPGALDDPDWSAAKVDYQTSRFPVFKQVRVQPLGQWNLPGFSFRRFRVRHKENLLRKIQVLPALGGDFATAHTGIERHDGHHE